MTEDDNEAQLQTECPFCKNNIPQGIYYCPRCGNNIAVQEYKNEKKLYNPLDDLQSAPQQNVQFMQQSIQQPIQAKKNVILVRNKTGEQIRIEKEYFRIGKGTMDNDYCILDNSAVSRSHAVLMTKGEQWIIVDLDSTNGTYVNGGRIIPRSEIALINGSTISLANEQFVFYLQ